MSMLQFYLRNQLHMQQHRHARQHIQNDMLAKSEGAAVLERYPYPGSLDILDFKHGHLPTGRRLGMPLKT